MVHTVRGIANEATGPSYSVRRLCEALNDDGRPVTLATLEPAPSCTPPVFLKTFRFGAGPRRLGRSPAMRRWLFSEAEANRITLLHTHNLWMMPNVYPSEVAKKHNLPLVISPRGTFSDYAFGSGSIVKRVFWPLVQGPALAVATCFHATAATELADIRRHGFRQPIAVIPNGVDIYPYDRPLRCEQRTLLYVGRLHQEKGLRLLLHAWQAIFERFPDWQLRIVGPDIGGHLSELTLLAASLRLRRVAFDGPLYGADKHKAYSAADAFILASPSENFGVAVAEALASGTPAIVTSGAPWEGLIREDAGWWVDHSVDAVAGALEQALDCSPDDLARRGQCGRDWMVREFSWALVGKKMGACYDWIINGGAPPCSVVLH